MSKTELAAIRIDDPAWGDKWRESDEYICLGCGSPAYLHPLTNGIWGCKSCGFTTEAIPACFARKTKPSALAVSV